MKFSELSSRLKEYIVREFGINADNRVIISDNGFVAVWNEVRTHLFPIGCDTCLFGKKDQNSQGYPIIAGKPLVPAENKLQLPGEFSAVVNANLWLCPDCQMPQVYLLPNFIS